MDQRDRAPSYGDVTGEYLALRSDAGVVTGEHEITWVRGPDAVSFLDGLLSQDVAALGPDSTARSFLLSPRGKLRAVLWVLSGVDEVGLVADAGLGRTVAADLERFKLRVAAEIDPEPNPVVEVWGPGSGRVLARAGVEAPEGWTRDGGVLVARADLGRLPRYFVAGTESRSLEAAGAVPVGALAATAVRIEAGEPKMGVDLDEDTIPQESGLVEEAVSFTKGCYLGQELVARIHSRGHVNRFLRGLTLRQNVIPPRGAELVSGGAAVGRLTSVGESLELRAPVALAMVRRQVEPGDLLEVRWPGGSAPADVRELPLDDFNVS